MAQLYPSAAHLILIRDNQILLLKRKNTGYEDGNYSLVAGHIETDETIIEAMLREGKEEAGIDINHNELSIVGMMHRKSKKQERIDFFLHANSWNNDIVNKEPEKCEELRWFALNNLPLNTIPYIRRGIKNYLDKKYFDEFGY